MDSLLAITEIFSNVTSYGEKAHQYRLLCTSSGVLERSVQLMKLLKDTVDIMIDHKIYEPEEKFATYAA